MRTHEKDILDLVDFKEKKVLDFGFDKVEAIIYAYKHGASSCVGVNFSPAAIDIAHNSISDQKLPKTELIQSNTLDFVNDYYTKKILNGGKTFDIVMMLDFVEHIPRNELFEILKKLRKIISKKAVIVINTPAYKYDNDVIKNGFDNRNLVDCYDESDNIPETKGMHCNKYTVVSLQKFMQDCGFINLTEAHFFVLQSLFENDIETITTQCYQVRWKKALELKTSLKPMYKDDIIEFPYPVTEQLKYHNFNEGNLSGFSLLLSETYKNEVFKLGKYDGELFCALNENEILNKTIFDVGGFIGVNSLLFAKRIGGNGKVIAFEPNPWNRNRMFKNISKNENYADQISVFELALSNINNEDEMLMSNEIDFGFSSTSRLSTSHSKIHENNLPGSFYKEKVKSVTLDSFVERTKLVPDIIKIDIEGAEHLLLLGGLNTLTKYKPILFIELHSEYCALQCSLILNDFGYQIFLINEEIDNRLLIKAIPLLKENVYSPDESCRRSSEINYIQNEIFVQTQRILKKEISLLSNDLENLQSTHQNLQTKHQDLKLEHLDLQTKHQDLKLEHQVLQTKHQDLKLEHQVLQTKHQDLELEHQDLQTKCQDFNDKITLIQEEKQALFEGLNIIINSKVIKYSNRIKILLKRFGITNFKIWNSLELNTTPTNQNKCFSSSDLSKFAPIVSQMAKTGEGTDACLALECLPVPVHYYSPIPDIFDLNERNIWSKISDLRGIDIDKESQIKLLINLGKMYGTECNWPFENTLNPNKYYSSNNSFNYGCAASLYSIIRFFKPKRIFEIGSGNSSLIISEAITKNKKSQKFQSVEYVVVDPFPNENLLSSLSNLTYIEKYRVELLNDSFFNKLEENDILFIDSSHSVKTGSDVNYLILDILPILAKGVIVHFHDITMPFEYPKEYYTNPNFRMFWTENYLLQAFLSLNKEFEVLLAMNFLMNFHLESFSIAFPHFDLSLHESSASSFWIRRK